MKLTNKEYLVDITLKKIEVKPTKEPSKISCEIHFGDNYLTIKLQPYVDQKGIVDFHQDRIRIPYASEVALVFKMSKNKKKSSFIGHYPLDLENYLKQNVNLIEIKGQPLEQTDAKVYFDCRIIDKAIFDQCSEDMDILEDEMMSPLSRKQTDPSVRLHNKASRINQRAESIKHHSQIQRNNKKAMNMKKNPQFNVMLNDEFYGELQKATQIISKKQTFIARKSILKNYERNEDGFLRSEKILQLETRLLKMRDQQRVGSFLIYSLVAGISFVFGFMAA